MRSTKHKAFTLVEILIVVVILGILAAIAIPRFASAVSDTQISATITEIQKIRRHIGVYQARNNQQLPTVIEGDGSWGQLIGRNHLLSPPINAWVGGTAGRLVKFGTGPDATFTDEYGWIYNQNTGEVWAAGFDADDRPIPRP